MLYFGIVVTNEATIFVMYNERGEEQLGLTLNETVINLIYRKKLPLNEEESYTSIVLSYDIPVIRGKYGIKRKIYEFLFILCYELKDLL